MYEISFGLHNRPFAAAPRVECYFPAATIEAAHQTLSRCIERAEGAGMVVGPSGTGKTLLCQVLAERFRERLDVVFLSNGRLGSRRTLLQGILHGLGQPYRDMDEGELRIALAEYVCGPRTSSRGMLLLADEAHTLPLRCLDELRMVTNLAVNGQPRTRLVLIGASLLEERLASPKLDSFSQRMAARCYLEAMTRTETEGYIRAQIAAAGGNGAAIFPAEACNAVYQATGGVPRLVNQVCDHVLVLAHAAGQRRVEPARVQEAWADLQQLPTPWNSEPRKERPVGEVIEFGALDDDSGQAAPQAATATLEPPPAPRDEPDAGEPSASTEPIAIELSTVCDPEPEPGEQLQEIQQMLGELEDVFRPAGTIGPEVEIVLDDPGNPFSEQFLEEEIVVDRCAAALAQRNREALATTPQTTHLSRNRDGQTPASDALRTSEARGPGTNPSGHATAPSVATERETLPLRSVVNVTDIEPEEPELVIDEDYDFIETVKAHPATPVRPQQYRSLFAQLRRA